MMPDQKRCEPATSIIGALGGFAEVAGRLDVDHSTVHRWTYPTDAPQGTGGRIPPRHWDALIEFARERGIELSNADFVSNGPINVAPAAAERLAS